MGAMSGDGVVVITGSNGDIGSALATRARMEGHELVGVDIAPDESGHEDFVQVDLSTVQGAGALNEHLASRPVAKLFHVAGGADIGELRAAAFTEVPSGSVDRTVGSNLMTAIYTVQALVPALMRYAAMSGRHAAVVLAGSLNADGRYGAPVYSSTKAALQGLAAALSTELIAKGVSINVASLGTTDTSRLRRLAVERGREPDTSLADLGQRLPYGAVLRPDDVANALWSISSVGLTISGETIRVDRGQYRTR